MRRRLIIYAKRPLPGYTKTRLGATVGMQQAAGVYARMLYTYLTNVLCAKLPHTRLELAVADPSDRAYFELAYPEFLVRPQIEDDDLGHRMAHSFQQAFSEGADAVVLTGSDIPGLTVPIIRRAFAALEQPNKTSDGLGVIGPATDGGYYLIGMRAPGADLFDSIAWSTNTVLTATYQRAVEQHIRLTPLAQLSDIDIEADYAAWTKAARRNCPDRDTR